MWSTIQLNDIFVLIFNLSSNEESWDPADVPRNYVILHSDNVFDLADFSYRIDQEVNAVDEMRQLPASRRCYGHHQAPTKLNRRKFDVTYAAYFFNDDRKQDCIVLHTYLGFISRRQSINYAITSPPSVILSDPILGDSTNRNNSLCRRSRPNAQTFIRLGVVSYIGTVLPEIWLFRLWFFFKTIFLEMLLRST